MKSLQIIKFSLSITLMALLSACIGSGDSGDGLNNTSNTSSAASIKLGVIRDSAIQNLNYSSCDSASAHCIRGSTDANGKFKYYEGASVEFLIGNLQVAQAQGQGLLTPENFVSTKEEVTNFASFLLGLDEDNNPNNGIKISSQAHVLASSNLKDQNMNYANRAQLAAIANKLDAELVSKEASRVHLEKNKLLQYAIAVEDRFALALVNKKNYSACCNLDSFDKSPSVRVKYEIWQALAYDLISSSELNNKIAEIEKQKEVADAVLNFTNTAVSIVGNVLSAKAGLVKGVDLEFYINRIQAAKNGLNLIITATYNGVEEEFTIDLEKNPAMVYAMTGMDILSLGNIGAGVISTAQAFSEDDDLVNSEVVNNIVKPLIDTAISETMTHIAKQGTKGALVKGVASKVIGKFTVPGLAIDVAKVAKDLYFAKELMNSRIDNESRQMAFDYLRAYYSGAGNDVWMNERYGFDTAENAALISLSAGYQKDWTDMTLEVLTSLVKQSFNYAMFLGGAILLRDESIYEDVDEIRRQQAAQLIAAYHNKIESFYTKITMQLGGIPSDDGSISTDGKFYALHCSGTNDLVTAQIETLGLPWNLDDPNTLSWLVPDGVRKASINDENNPVIYHFDRPGVFSIGAKLKKLNSDVTHTHYQNYIALNCAESQSSHKYQMTEQQTDSATYTIKTDYQRGFIGWYDQNNQLLTTENSYQYFYANYNSIKKITPVWDTSPPNITLVGASTLNLFIGDVYSDPGAEASDNIDGDISSQIIVGGDVVNTNSVGNFTVTYNVTDAAGNAADEVTRLVNITITESQVTKVTAITPLSMSINQMTTFWITGQNFPETMTAQIQGADCPAEYKKRISATLFTLQCQHNVAKTLTLTVVEQSEGSLLQGGEAQVQVNSALASTTSKLNDTGITWGGNSPSGNNADCTGETIGEQDCSHGRDALATAGQLTKVGGGMAGFDFTKLDSNGNALADQTQDYATQPWACVKDNHTGLIWEVKTPDATGTQLHSMNDRFTWYNTNNVTNGGVVGFAVAVAPYYRGATCTGYNDADNSTLCNTQAFVARVNKSNTGAGLCGATDWRLPDLNELQSIVHFGKINPAIDENYFPNSTSESYWSSSVMPNWLDDPDPDPDKDNSHRSLYFGNGSDWYMGSFRYNGVRLVRGGQ